MFKNTFIIKILKKLTIGIGISGFVLALIATFTTYISLIAYLIEPEFLLGSVLLIAVKAFIVGTISFIGAFVATYVFFQTYGPEQTS